MPQRCQIHAFVEFALVDCPVAKKAGGHRVPVLHLVGEGHADGHRQTAPDDRVAAVKPRRAVKNVHRSAASAAAPLLFAEHLGHQPIHPDPAGDCLTMLTIGGDDGIPRRQSLHNPDRYRFFPVVKVQKSEDLLRLVQLHAF